MELMSESVGILLVLLVSDLGHAAVQRNAEKLSVYLCTSAADWRWSLVCFHNHCLFYVSVRGSDGAYSPYSLAAYGLV